MGLHLQTKSFQYCEQYCAMCARIGTFTQYVQHEHTCNTFAIQCTQYCTNNCSLVLSSMAATIAYNKICIIAQYILIWLLNKYTLLLVMLRSIFLVFLVLRVLHVLGNRSHTARKLHTIAHNKADQYHWSLLFSIPVSCLLSFDCCAACAVHNAQLLTDLTFKSMSARTYCPAPLSSQWTASSGQRQAQVRHCSARSGPIWVAGPRFPGPAVSLCRGEIRKSVQDARTEN